MPVYLPAAVPGSVVTVTMMACELPATTSEVFTQSSKGNGHQLPRSPKARLTSWPNPGLRLFSPFSTWFPSAPEQPMQPLGPRPVAACAVVQLGAVGSLQAVFVPKAQWTGAAAGQPPAAVSNGHGPSRM